MATPCALRAHAHQSRSQRGRQALVDGRRLVLWPGTPTHCACSVRVVRNGHCLFTAQLSALRARARRIALGSEHACARSRSPTRIIVLRRGGVVLGASDADGGCGRALALPPAAQETAVASCGARVRAHGVH